jgi:hypothetical protein
VIANGVLDPVKGLYPDLGRTHPPIRRTARAGPRPRRRPQGDTGRG